MDFQSFLLKIFLLLSFVGTLKLCQKMEEQTEAKPLWWKSVADYEFIQLAWWRSTVATDDLLDCISEKLCDEVMFNDEVFVYESLKNECVGDIDNIAPLYMIALNSPETAVCRKQLETINFFQALWCLNKYQAYELNEELFQKVHKILMMGLIDKRNTQAGEFSTQQRFTIYKGEITNYLHPSEIQQQLDALVVHYSSCILHLLDNKQHLSLRATLDAVVKITAFFLWNFLRIHPFSDGNGRLGRLLANKILSFSFPFHVPIMFPDIYIETLKSRDAAELATLIVDSIHFILSKNVK